MDMIERVAEALGKTNYRNRKGEIDLTILARAAIEAMREPTKEMIYDGNTKIDNCIDFYNYDSGSGYTVEPHAAYETWRIMIDVALIEPAPKTDC